VIDFTRVPALPPLLGRILEVRAGAINAMGERLCRERGAVAAERLPVHDASSFASDGFHGSELGYRAWAAHVVGAVLALPARPRGRADEPPIGCENGLAAWCRQGGLRAVARDAKSES
jgi:hypothetical protein